jgi:hypothetical protein
MIQSKKPPETGAFLLGWISHSRLEQSDFADGMGDPNILRMGGTITPQRNRMGALNNRLGASSLNRVTNGEGSWKERLEPWLG